jgi:chaperonin GroES
MSSKINIKPLGDRVVIEPLDDDKYSNKTKGGIIIPETVDKERPEKGKVVAVGPGRINDDGETIPLSVKKGQVVIFAKYGPDEIKIEGKEYFILNESSILGIIED